MLFTGSATFSSELSSTFKRLAEDESSKVRRTVASGFHEVRREREGEREERREGGGRDKEVEEGIRNRKFGLNSKISYFTGDQIAGDQLFQVGLLLPATPERSISRGLYISIFFKVG